jgi:hypothetical protein
MLHWDSSAHRVHCCRVESHLEFANSDLTRGKSLHGWGPYPSSPAAWSLVSIGWLAQRHGRAGKGKSQRKVGNP